MTDQRETTDAALLTTGGEGTIGVWRWDTTMRQGCNTKFTYVEGGGQNELKKRDFSSKNAGGQGPIYNQQSTQGKKGET